MDTVDISYLIQRAGDPCHALRHVSHSWRAASWQVHGRALDAALTRCAGLGRGAVVARAPPSVECSLSDVPKTQGWLNYVARFDPEGIISLSDFSAFSDGDLQRALELSCRTGHFTLIERICQTAPRPRHLFEKKCLKNRIRAGQWSAAKFTPPLQSAVLGGHVEPLRVACKCLGISTIGGLSELTNSPWATPHVNVLQFLREYLGANAVGVREAGGNLEGVVAPDCLPAIEYLHKEIGLQASDFAAPGCGFLRALATGHARLFPIVQYLDRTMGMRAVCFTESKECLGNVLAAACARGELDTVQYLHEMGLGSEAFRLHMNAPLRAACAAGHVSIVEYLLHNVGLSFKDLEARNMDGLRQACAAGFSGVVAIAQALDGAPHGLEGRLRRKAKGTPYTTA